MSKHAAPLRRRRRSGGWVVGLTGVAASVILALSVSGTFSAYTAAITNTGNSANTVSIGMTEGPDSSTVECTSTVTGTTTCSRNMYAGANLRPGDVAPATTTTFGNTGSVTPSSFTLQPSTCTGGSSGTNSICNWLLVTVTWSTTVNGAQTATTVVPKTSVASIAGNTYSVPNPPGPGAKGTMTVQVQLDTAAPNDSQGQSLGQTLDWTFTA